MLRNQLRRDLAHVGMALREPESFVVAWDRNEVHYAWHIWTALAVTAIIGTTTYGMTMGIIGGASDVLAKAVACTAAAGLAWSIPLPALYILNSFTGSRLRASTTFLVALVTTSWGGLALIASVPINWFFSVAVPEVFSAASAEWLVLIVNLAVFAGVGVAMIDVFGRVMEAVEPHRGRGPVWWLVIVAAIGGELFYAFGLFEFVLRAS